MKHTEEDTNFTRPEDCVPDGFLPGLYQHYKGDRYIALHLVTHHETGEKFVVYVSLSHGTLRLREWNTTGKDSWCDHVEPNGMKVDPVPENFPYGPRFRYMGPADGTV